ncbi:succinylglutamate desuccinylase/aspartoacylase family protein [Pararhodobacter oceanensis]|uniref:succinylglutamate desuccinylase/aspartoacylase family protein n=1 Tax=Pararhodobacter oceanensis TaxID=2172121 RepID=UPI003A94A5D1
MLSYGAASCSLDLETPGKRSGFISLNHSDNRHAFSTIQIPIGVIKGGDGPTVILSAGNHGDEYEGQVLLHRLMQALTPEQVPGRVIILPALNLPAVLDRARVSPLDQGNMNRAFPGMLDAGPTRLIAGFVTRHLIQRADVILDFHSGGTATEYVNCGFYKIGPNPELNLQNLHLADCFGAPFTMVRASDGTGGDFDTAAYNAGTRFLSVELGGMGRFSPAAFRIGWDGCSRVLKGAGVLLPDALGHTPEAGETCFIDIHAASAHVSADHHGLAALDCPLGTWVERGQKLGEIFDIHNLGAPPQSVTASRAGVLAVVRRNPLVSPGDHLCLICDEIPRDVLMSRVRCDAQA